MRIQIVEIPSQTSEDILTRFEQHIKLPSAFLVDPVNVPLHVPLRVARADNRDLGLQQLWERFLPFVRASGVAQTRVEENHTVQVRIEWLEVVGLVHRVEIVHVGCDLHLSAQSVFHDSSKGVLGRSLWEREFFVPVGHAFRPDEYQMEHGSGEHVTELKPDITGQGGLSTRSKDEKSDRRRFETQSLEVGSFTRLGRVQSIPQSLIQLVRIKPY